MHPSTTSNPAFHHQAVLELVGLKVTGKFANYLAEAAIDAVDTVLGNAFTPRGMTSPDSIRVSTFKRFVWNFIHNAPVGMPILLVTLVYITRAKKYLHIEAEDRAYERVFLGALIVASKYTNDASFRTVRWALATVIPGKQATLGKRDVNKIEREFLGVLDWQLGFTQEHILVHYNAIMGLYREAPKPASNTPPTSSQSPTRITAAPPPRYSMPRGTSSTARKSMTDCDSSTSLYPTVVAGQPFFLKAEEAKHPHSCASDLPTFPHLWHGNNRTISEQHTARRIAV